MKRYKIFSIIGLYINPIILGARVGGYLSNLFKLFGNFHDFYSSNSSIYNIYFLSRG